MRDRSWLFPILLTLSALAWMPAVAAAATAATEAQQGTPDPYDTKCNNTSPCPPSSKKETKCCPKTVTGSLGTTGDCEDGSYIGWVTREHRHTGLDYLPSGILPAVGGCAPCGAGGGAPNIGRLPELTFYRHHRSRHGYWHSIIGGSQHSQYDSHISFSPSSWRSGPAGEDVPVVRLAMRGLDGHPLLFWEDNAAQGDTSIDGVYRHENAYYKSMTFYADTVYADTDALSVVTTDPLTATVAVLEDAGGNRWVFELFTGNNDERLGRSLRHEDRNGNAVSLAYLYPATATDAELGGTPSPTYNPREKFWTVDTITDAYGRVATLHYDPGHLDGSTGTWGGLIPVQAITWPNGTQTVYTQEGGELTAIDHPDGTRSTFTYEDEIVDGLVVGRRQVFDDAAAEDTHRRKVGTYTVNNGIDPVTGQVVNQTGGLLKGITSLDGEVMIQLWTNRTSNGIYVYKGGSELRYYQIEGNVVVGEAVSMEYVNDSTAAPDAGSLHWETIRDDSRNSTVEDVAASTDRLARGVSFSWNTVQRYVAGTQQPDGSSSSVIRNDFLQPLVTVDRLGRVTQDTYDARGNHLSQTVGLELDAAGAVVDLDPSDTSTWSWTYNDRGQPLTATDANGHTTDYVYTAAGYLEQVIHPADRPQDPRAVEAYTYDSAGLLATHTDPLGRTVTYDYDQRNRVTRIDYSDGSSEFIEYGSGAQVNLVTARVDRSGSRTEFGYDGYGRRTLTTTAAGTPEAIEESCTYLPGTSLEKSCTSAGETVTYTYDYRQRRIATHRQANGGTTLSTFVTFDVWGRQLGRTDPYGRRSFTVFDVNDRPVRTVIETVPGALGTLPAVETPPSGGYAGTGAPGEAYMGSARDAALMALERDLSSNAAYLIEESAYDAEGQLLSSTDARGNRSTHAYDQQGRRIRSIEAAGTSIAATTEWTYDVQGNVLEIRHPRHFSETGDFLTMMRYTGRNLLASRTEAAATTEAATESFTYHLDRRIKDRIDFRGETWTTTWGRCCGRVQGQLDPVVTLPDQPAPTRPAQISRHDAIGNLSHQGVVADYAGVIFPTRSAPTTDLPDGQTLNETTTRYDARQRPIAQTVWLVPLGGVDANDPPIADRASAAVNAATHPASAGLTTTWIYDDDLTDGVGLDASHASELAVLGAGFFTAGADGSAVARTNPAGETTVNIADALGRTVLTIDGGGDLVRMGYDSLIAGTPGAPAAGSGQLLVTTQVRDPGGLALTTSQRSDGAGRVLAVIDGEGRASTFGYDATGNRISQRDPNGVGENCVYDARNRDIICTDTQGDVRFKIYNAHSVLQTVDALGVAALGGSSGYPADSQTALATATLGVTTCRYDARDRKVQCRDRVAGLTDYVYDANNNLLSIEDGDRSGGSGGITEYDYDARNLLVVERFPGHNLTTNYDQRLYAYDAARRLVSRDDQSRELTIYHYDLANRLLERDYPDHLVPAGVDDQDRFTYDAASRLLSATSSRFEVVVARSYHADSTLATETLQIDGLSYEIDHDYDGAGRPDETIYPDASLLASTWTDRDQLKTRTYAGSLLATLDYDYGMRETTRSLGNSLTTTRTYGRGDNLVTKIDAPGVTAFGYDDYDANKRKRSETDGSPLDWDQSFGYDAEDRLTSWDRAGSTAASIPSDRDWTLSKVGDWQDVTIDGVLEARDHNAVHELTQRQIGAGSPIALGYDPKGNLSSDGSQSYSWDFENRLITASGLPDSGSASYRYDALGRRVQKTVSTATDGTVVTTYVSAGAQVLSEYESIDGGPTQLARSYVYASYVDDPVAMVVPGAGTFFYHQNHLYSVSAITDATGAVVERYGYDAYGDSVVTNAAGMALSGNGSSVGNPYRFTGRRLDAETGLQYFRARYYSVAMGRFVSRDPAGYIDGMSIYRGYFVPLALDSSGMAKHGDIRRVGDRCAVYLCTRGRMQIDCTGPAFRAGPLRCRWQEVPCGDPPPPDGGGGGGGGGGFSARMAPMNPDDEPRGEFDDDTKGDWVTKLIACWKKDAGLVGTSLLKVINDVESWDQVEFNEGSYVKDAAGNVNVDINGNQPYTDDDDFAGGASVEIMYLPMGNHYYQPSRANRSWTAAEALAHELLHVQWYKNGNQLDHHNDPSWEREELTITGEAARSSCKW